MARTHNIRVTYRFAPWAGGPVTTSYWYSSLADLAWQLADATRRGYIR